MLAVPIAGIREAAQMDLDIRSVLQFAAVAEELSFTRAGSVRFRAKWPQVSNSGGAERGTIERFVTFQR